MGAAVAFGLLLLAAPPERRCCTDLGEDRPISVRGLAKGGVIYTCRGGFIDTAQLQRGFADAASIARAIGPLAGGEATLELPDGARVHLEAPPYLSDPVDLVARLALRLAHERALWDHLFAEAEGRAGAFSPEELYSHALGAKLAALALTEGSTAAPHHLLTAAVVELEPSSPAETRAALAAAARERRPSRQIGPRLAPWRPAGPKGCTPAILEIPDASSDRVSLADIAELEVPVPARLVETFDARRRSADLPALLGAGVPTATTAAPFALATPLRELEAKAERPAPQLGRLQLLPVEAFGALERPGGALHGGGGFAVSAARLESAGGDVALFDLSVAQFTGPGGLVARGRALWAPALWLGSAREDESFVLPLFALDEDVAEDAWIGAGAQLFHFQIDERSQRRSIRPVEIDLAINALANGYAEDHLFRRLVLVAGLGLDDTRGADDAGETSLYAKLGLSARWRSAAERYELEGYLAGRQDLFEGADRQLEAGARATRRFFLWERAAPGEVDRAIGVVHLQIEASYLRWARALGPVTDWIHPVAASRSLERQSAQLVFVFGFADLRWSW